MKNNYRIVFMGTPDFGIPSLDALCANDYEPIAIYTQPDRINGRGKKIIYSPVKSFAIDHNIPYFQPESLRNEEEIERLRDLKPDLLIVIAYGKILPKAILDIPTYGAINVHASLLPKYRGAAPIQRAIIDGEKETGVTIMQLDEGMDTGNIVSQKSIAISETMTSYDLFEALGKLGAEALISVMDELPKKLNDSVPQDHTQATYAEKITKEMGHIDWTKPAQVLSNLIRGMYPNPGTYTFFRNKRIKIHQCTTSEKNLSHKPGTVISLNDGVIGVQTGNGILWLCEIQPENHKRMSAEDFINGYQVKINDNFD